MRLAYLTTEYPKVSHTFIRREILELERRGHTVERLAIRSAGDAIADEADRSERDRTWCCLSQAPLSILAAWVACMITRPIRSWRALRATWKMSRASDRGLIRHLAYVLEAAAIVRRLRARGIHHVHVHFGTNAAAVARLMRILGGPTYSLTIHGPDEFDAPRGFALREKVKDAVFVVAISQYCASQVKRWADPEDWSKVHVVHCTVGDEFLQGHAPIDPQSRRLVCVGRLAAQKGHLVLLEAVAALLREGERCGIVLAGDGELRPLIEDRIRALGLDSTVTITGWVDEMSVRSLINGSRAIVQPSFAEGLPVVMMEALAMGRPVIGTMITGVPELVNHGESGWLVTAGSVDELAAAIRDVLHKPVDALNAMGSRGRDTVLRQHCTATEVNHLEVLLSRTVQEGGA